MNLIDENKLMRRVAGVHNIRLDGIMDILLRCREASVMDIGCNRGQVGYEFYLNGATSVHGCDIYEQGIKAAREWFTDLRNCQCKFEVVDLTVPNALHSAFGATKYDITVMLATYHKLKRIMTPNAIEDLMRDIGDRTAKYFCWRGTSEKANDNELEIIALDKVFKGCGLKRIHTSYISLQLGVSAIWSRN